VFLAMSMSEDVRWKQRFSNFKKAAMQLTEFVEKEELNKFEVQGLIQCFGYTFELAWKTMKDYLELEGFEVESPRSTIQTAFQIQLITEGHVWIDALNKRNLMAHTYNEEVANEAEQLIINKYFPAIINLLNKLEE
jgi:nucleotidyltransferase substrate binding protein (TIGR01987 family)